MLVRLARSFYGLALVSLPWAGVGVLRLTTGRDWGWGLQPSWLFLSLALLVTMVERIGRGSLLADLSRLRGSTIPGWWILGAAAVLAALLISSIGLFATPSGVPVEEAWSRFAKQVIQLGIMVAFVVFPAVWTRGETRWNWTVRVLMIGAAIQVAYGVLQAWEYYQPIGILPPLEFLATSNPAILAGSSELYLDGKMHEIPRLRGTVCEPLYLGNYLLLILPLVVLMPPNRRRLLLGIALLFLMFGTWSRGAWLGLAGSLVFIVVLMAVSRRGIMTLLPDKIYLTRVITVSVVVLVLLGGLAWLSGWDGFRLPAERLGQTFSRHDWSNLTRLYSMQAGWRAFLLSPVVGVGWGQFGFHFPVLVDPLGLQSQFTWPVVNNFPLLILCETGLVGFLVFMGLLVSLGSALVRALASSSSSSHRLRLLATATAFVGVWFQLLTFSQYNLPHIWVALGLVLAATADRTEDRNGGGA